MPQPAELSVPAHSPDTAVQLRDSPAQRAAFPLVQQQVLAVAVPAPAAAAVRQPAAGQVPAPVR